MKVSEYWSDCIAQAAEKCDLDLSAEQLDCLAAAASNGHEHYGQTFYSPPDSDRITDLEKEYQQKIKRQQQEHERSLEALSKNAAWQARQQEQRIYQLENRLKTND